MTKLDGDSRAGAAISLKYVTGVPIKFIGTGEQIGTTTSLEDFTPEGMASRILGGGDLGTLINQAQMAFDQNVMEERKRYEKGIFTFNDFQKMMSQTVSWFVRKNPEFSAGNGKLEGDLGNTDAAPDESDWRIINS